MFLFSISYIRLVAFDTNYSVSISSCLLVVHSYVIFNLHGSQCVKEWFNLSFISYTFIFCTTAECNKYKINITIGYKFIDDSVLYLVLVVRIFNFMIQILVVVECIFRSRCCLVLRWGECNAQIFLENLLEGEHLEN
jgi:hypothetical protein